MQWYTGNTFYDTLLIVGFLYALMIFVSSLYGTAAYGGRFGGSGKSKGIKLGEQPSYKEPKQIQTLEGPGPGGSRKPRGTAP